MNAQDNKLGDFIPLGGGACSINGCRSAPSAGELSYALDLIRSCKQPAIYSGDGAILSEAYSEIDELSQLLTAPVFSTISGKGIMTAENERYFGTVGLFGEKPNHAFLRTKADLLIVVGNRLTEDDTVYFKIPPPRFPMIQIDIDPAIIGLSYHPWGVVGDPKTTLAEIINDLRTGGIFPKDSMDQDQILSSREQNLLDLRKNHLKYCESDNGRWRRVIRSNPNVSSAISKVLDGDDYLITDASASARWIGPYYPVKSLGRKIITARGVVPHRIRIRGINRYEYRS